MHWHAVAASPSSTEAPPEITAASDDQSCRSTDRLLCIIRTRCTRGDQVTALCGI